ncbi:alpha/beta fold hydrolase [Streptomyces sp. NPDC013187]|uniref:alpha/beta fold hydrolase n=1 Tax=Streptomyces sp. NPDC013187 TaxID=3364865 RepID=UPI0036CC2B9A
METHTLETAGADLVYDVRGPLPAAEGRAPLFMIGQPMDASGFVALAARFPERTVVTYDPRGLGRSARKDGRVDHTPQAQADDVHAVIEALGDGPVEMFASSGGAVTALEVVAKYPADVTALVAHEPPLITLLLDGPAAVTASVFRGSVADIRAPGQLMSWPTAHTPPVRSALPAAPADPAHHLGRSATRRGTAFAEVRPVPARPASTVSDTRPGTKSDAGSGSSDRPEESRRATKNSPSAAKPSSNSR